MATDQSTQRHLPGAAGPTLALRVRAVAEADRRHDLDALAGELDMLAEAATEWAQQVRARAASRPDASRNPCAI